MMGLAANAPVAQAVLGFFFACAAFAERRADSVKGLREVETVKGAARDKVGVFFRGVPFLPGGGVVVLAVFGDDLFDGQAVFVGKCEVAFVMPRHGHHRTVAVAPEDVVGDPHFQCFTTERVDDVAPGRHPFFFHGRHIGFGNGSGLAFVDEGGKRRVIGGGSGCQRVFGGNGEVGGAEQGIGAGGIDLHVLDVIRQALAAVVAQGEADGHAARFANPVALHGFDALRPAVQRIKIA